MSNSTESNSVDLKSSKVSIISELSVEELQEALESKKLEEIRKLEALRREEIHELREQRKQFVKNISEIDKKLHKLESRGDGKEPLTTAQVLSEMKKLEGKEKDPSNVESKHPLVSVSKLRKALETKGYYIANINQTLSYLKRSGKIENPERAMYSIVGD